MRRTALWIQLSVFLLISVSCVGQTGRDTGREGTEEREVSQREAASRSPDFTVDLSAIKRFSFSYGVGDSRGFGAIGGTPGALSIDQSLEVDFNATALGSLTIVGELDDQQSDAMQLLAVSLDTAKVDGVLGDFDLVEFGSCVVDKRMFGVRLDYLVSEGRWLTGFISEPEGVVMSRTFRGTTSCETIEYSAYRRDEEWRAQVHRFHIDGLCAFDLQELYVEKFTDIEVDWTGEQGVEEILATVSLAHLHGALGSAEPIALRMEEFAVLAPGGDKQVLVLMNDPRIYARKMLKSAIAAYDGGSEDGATTSYPFAEGSDFELAFLDELMDYVRISAGDESHRVSDAILHQYYLMDRDGVVEGTVLVTLSEDGQTFRSVDDALLDDYSFVAFHEYGILQLDFPALFFEAPEPTIRVEFGHALAMGFSLGMGSTVIPGSDRVYLNDTMLERDVDYDIDYEIGIVTLGGDQLPSEADTVRIEYEVYGGGLGSGADYATYIYGARLEVPLADTGALRVAFVRSFEDESSIDDPSKVSTMPNDHRVLSIDYSLDVGSFEADVSAGYCWEEAPFDGNQKAHQPNRITSIVSSAWRTFVGHKAGLTAYDGSEWKTYSGGSRLPSTTVQCLGIIGGNRLLIGTDQGLSVIQLDGSFPLDLVGNWRTYRSSDGLPGDNVRAMLVDSEEVLWIATSEGLASIRVEDLGVHDSWLCWNDKAEFESLAPITVLRSFQSGILIGTSDGAYSWSGNRGPVTPVPETSGVKIHDIIVTDESYIIASESGLREYTDEKAGRWIWSEGPVYCVAVGGGVISFGTSDGLRSSDSGSCEHVGTTITSLERTEAGVLWVGSQVDDSGELAVWQHDVAVTAFLSDETKIAGENPSAYVSVSDVESLLDGYGVRASFEQQAEAYRVSGDIYLMTPEYRQVGSIMRSNAIGWSLRGEQTIARDVLFEARHEYTMSGESSPRTASSSWASLSWGPLDLFLALKTSAEDVLPERCEQAALEYSAVLERWRPLGEDLQFSASWENLRSTASNSRSTDWIRSANVEASWWPLETLSLTGIWTRSSHALGGIRKESEAALALDATWGCEMMGGWIDLSYGGETKSSTRQRERQWEHVARAEWQLPKLSCDAWSLASGTLWLSGEVAEQASCSAVADVSGRMAACSVDAKANHSVVGLGEERWDQDDSLYIRLRHDGLLSMRPAVSTTVTRQRAVYGDATRDAIDVDVTASVDWEELGEGTADRTDMLFIAAYDDYGLMSVSVQLNNIYSTDLSEQVLPWLGRVIGSRVSDDVSVKIQIATEWTYGFYGGSQEAVMQATGRFAVCGRTGWDTTLGFTACMGQESAGDLYKSLLLTVDVEVPFVYSEGH